MGCLILYDLSGLAWDITNVIHLERGSNIHQGARFFYSHICKMTYQIHTNGVNSMNEWNDLSKITPHHQTQRKGKENELQTATICLLN